MEKVEALPERAAVGNCAGRLQPEWGRLELLHARSRSYRWGEDGIAGISDGKQHLCFALALWNRKDGILKSGPAADPPPTRKRK